MTDHDNPDGPCACGAWYKPDGPCACGAWYKPDDPGRQMTDPTPIKLEPALRNDSWLTAFIYRLLRDDLPFGRVEAIIRDMEKSGADCFQLSEDDLAAYSRRLAEKLYNKSSF